MVNFNDEYYLDTDGDFTSDQRDLNEALSRIDTRGSTALYDAVIGSLGHIKKGHKDKRVLLVITDGDDDASAEVVRGRCEGCRGIQRNDLCGGSLQRRRSENGQENGPAFEKGSDRTFRSDGGPSLLSRQFGRCDSGMRADSTRNSKSVHHWLLSDRYGEGRHLSPSSPQGVSSWWTGQTFGANANWILRAKGFVCRRLTILFLAVHVNCRRARPNDRVND